MPKTNASQDSQDRFAAPSYEWECGEDEGGIDEEEPQIRQVWTHRVHQEEQAGSQARLKCYSCAYAPKEVRRYNFTYDRMKRVMGSSSSRQIEHTAFEFLFGKIVWIVRIVPDIWMRV